jgi:type IV pilus assembly protein PilM
MAIQPGVWGIDLGQCALKALRVENIDGQVTATAFDYVEHPKILSQPDADPDQLTREALEKFLSRNSLKGDLVAISIPGQSGLARFVKLPPVEEKKISDIVRFEAKQQIPFNLEEVVWDYQKLNTGLVTEGGFAMETEIGLFAIKRETVNRYLQHFKDVNVEVHIVQMAPLALCNFVSYDLLHKSATGEGGEASGKKRCVVALDIGADNSNLVITDGERIIWQRPIPLGGNHFTRALTKDMKLTFAKAEHLKRNATKSPELKQILSSLKPVLNDFVGEVQRSLGYFTNTHRDASVQYMMGLGNAFRLPGLQKFLSEKLQIDVQKLQKLERLAGDEVVNQPTYTENVLSYAVAYGLALQGLREARLYTNLLPQEIRVERMIRAKKPWAVTAAAALLLGTSMLALGFNRQFVAVASKVVKDERKKGDDTVSEAKRYETQYTAVENDIKTHTNDVKSIVLGQDERMNWIQFNQFVNRCLPRPDGSNLWDQPSKPDNQSAKQLYWNESAKEAYRKFVDQQTGNLKPGEKNDEEQWRDDLVQANVESVYCVYANDLGQFLNGLKGSMDPEVLKLADEKVRTTPPEGKGWVCEVRGYTYHRDNYRFVIKAVVHNLARTPIRVKLGESTVASAESPPPATNTAPAPAPAATGTQTAAAAKADDKSKDKAGEKPAEPNPSDVSHVILHSYYIDRDPEPHAFYLISSRMADALTGGRVSAGRPGGTSGGMDPTAMKSMMMGGGMGGPGAAQPGGGESKFGTGGGGAGSWSPLGSGGTLGGASRGGVSGGGVQPGGGMKGARGGGMMGMEQMMGGARAGATLPAPGTPESDKSKKKAGRHQRTEFVIFFIWKEPLSPLVMEADSAPAAADTGAAAAPAAPFGGK